MCRIILCKPQREEDKLIDHEEERRQTHPDITNMISPVLTHISLKFYYRKYMLRKKKKMILKILKMMKPHDQVALLQALFLNLIQKHFFRLLSTPPGPFHLLKIMKSSFFSSVAMTPKQNKVAAFTKGIVTLF